MTLLPRRLEHALSLTTTRENKEYLPGFPLDPSLQIAHALAPALMEAQVLVLACPMKGLRETCLRVQTALPTARQLRWVISLCKGLEPETLLRPCEIISTLLPDYTHGALSGPSFAHEVAAGKPTAITLASHGDEESLRLLQSSLSSPSLRVYASHDLTGVELGGCLKNIYAIGAGISDGLKLGDNARAAYITRALNEMVVLGKALGGDIATFYGLSGFGDLVVTCNGKGSRNRTFGEHIAQGRSVTDILQGRRDVIEGYWATASFYALTQKKGIEAPLLAALYAVLYEGLPPRQAIEALMRRELKTEKP